VTTAATPVVASGQPAAEAEAAADSAPVTPGEGPTPAAAATPAATPAADADGQAALPTAGSTGSDEAVALNMQLHSTTTFADDKVQADHLKSQVTTV
jgi:hypothetical protein